MDPPTPQPGGERWSGPPTPLNGPHTPNGAPTTPNGPHLGPGGTPPHYPMGQQPPLQNGAPLMLGTPPGPPSGPLGTPPHLMGQPMLGPMEPTMGPGAAGMHLALGPNSGPMGMSPSPRPMGPGGPSPQALSGPSPHPLGGPPPLMAGPGLSPMHHQMGSPMGPGPMGTSPMGPGAHLGGHSPMGPGGHSPMGPGGHSPMGPSPMGPSPMGPSPMGPRMPMGSPMLDRPPDHPMRHSPYMGQPDYRLYELNKRLQQRSEESDNLWWDAFATEFFEDDATLTLSFCLEDGLKRYTIGRTLIPRYFRSIFEGGVTDLYYILRHAKESFHTTTISLDCEQAMMITHHGKPMFTKVVTEGRLILEFTFDDMMRVRSWHFSTRQHKELIPRQMLNMQDPSVMEQLSKNITRQGLTNYTLNFLRLCVILEPMQELMSRHKAYGLNPRDCLKTTLFQKWQRMVAPPEANRTQTKRRKRKSSQSNAAGNTNNNTTPPGGKQKRSPGPQSFAPGDVMVVGEPTLMGGEFGDEDERLITRLENNQFDANGVEGGDTENPASSQPSTLPGNNPAEPSHTTVAPSAGQPGYHGGSPSSWAGTQQQQQQVAGEDVKPPPPVTESSSAPAPPPAPDTPAAAAPGGGGQAPPAPPPAAAVVKTEAT